MNTQHIILAILSSALFGMNIVLSKYGVQHFPPLLFAALRFGSMIPLIFLFPRPKVPFLTMASISLCWGVFYIGSINYALDNGVDAGTATILTQISTFLGFGLAWLVFKQAPKIEQISGALVGFLGICAIFANTFSAGFSPAVLVLLFAALSFATGNILVKRQGISSPSLAIWVNVYSFVPTLIVSLALEEGQLASVMLAGAFDWMTVFFAGWVSTLIGTQLWMKVVNSYDLNTVLPFRSLVPIFGILFAIVLLDEAYTAETWIGMTLVIIGLLITQSRTLWSKLKPPMAVSTILCATILPSANANQDVIPVVVIGSGCAGLSAAYVTAEYGNETVIFAGPIKGGDLNAKTEVGNWMGIDTTMGEEIISDVMEQIEDFEVRIINETIQSVDFSKAPFTLTSSAGKTYLANRVIVATGTKSRHIDIPGAKEHRNRLLYNWDIHKDVKAYKNSTRGKRVAVIGGGIDGMKKAFYAVFSGAKEVRMFVRSDTLKMPPWRQKFLQKKPGVLKVKRGYTPSRIDVTEDNKTRLNFDNGETYDADIVVVSAGGVPRSQIFEGHLKLNKKGNIIVDAKTMETSVKGVYACGDVTDASGPHPQAMIAAGDGMKAGYSLVESLSKTG